MSSSSTICNAPGNTISLILTVIGDDRPGLVEQLATAISSHHGNWLESSMSHLSGKFAGIVCLSIADAQLANRMVDVLEEGVDDLLGDLLTGGGACARAPEIEDQHRRQHLEPPHDRVRNVKRFIEIGMARRLCQGRILLFDDAPVTVFFAEQAENHHKA